jgi:hypothetical protein
MRSLLLLVILTAACGDNEDGKLVYSNPPASTGKLRLVKVGQTKDDVTLALIVGKEALTGYSAGFNLPVGHGLVRLAEFTPGKALDPGSSPPAAHAAQPLNGPLADNLVTAISQKATGTGSIETDTALPPNTVLYTVRLTGASTAADGVVFDGTAADFHLPSGGMRDRSGTTVVEPIDVAIGKLEVHQ